MYKKKKKKKGLAAQLRKTDRALWAQTISRIQWACPLRLLKRKKSVCIQIYTHSKKKKKANELVFYINQSRKQNKNNKWPIHFLLRANRDEQTKEMVTEKHYTK